MDVCAGAHPLCLGISWNVDMKSGWGNCYPKNNITDSDTSSPKGTEAITHSAQVANLPSSNGICPSNTTYAAGDGKIFEVDCFDKRTGAENFTSIHSADVASCMDTCSMGSNQTCVGVLFDNVLVDGYENCYLLNDTGSP